MLHLPLLHKLNLKFSAWTMSKVSVRHHAIVLSESKILKFCPEDVHKVFGIPCGHRNVRGRDGFILPEAVQFIKGTLGMDKTGVHSLKAAEEFLLRDISESSSKLEKDYFQIAFVIFVMGHVLAPTTKHDYATIDYWGALANTEAISQFNWCEYVLESLLEAVRRVKNNMLAGNLNTNLVGCHLWLQVFFLDNINLGMFNKRHDVLPRIGAYDQASMRKIGTSVLSCYNCTVMSTLQRVCCSMVSFQIVCCNVCFGLAKYNSGETKMYAMSAPSTQNAMKIVLTNHQLVVKEARALGMTQKQCQEQFMDLQHRQPL
ncbi:hypothetical protein CFC21_058467 [Triticum aestivum]|uniref:Aminotransferase-like plant mobile domain-containing protein n=2 Tax=Triticum aestivum TaxID=4565 RepID=A0A9R1GN30_WHEAT|nr:uncharacterized protein LOC123095075 [Triticum aestivum]KAF7050053.1 hypothetical protein CFC21_058467 [Triticum aestivum]